MITPLARKLTLPVGVGSLPEMVAVKVMGARISAGLGVTVSEVWVVAPTTEYAKGAEALPPMLALPE